eukprot:CAMPEP_0180107824 /NCGR_PEP_ID=MMETSP0985-20121206/33520_1 /TAXON_ID=483367 /ORGANISM="non described non described, Strain CCMP 2436" /LENGTH=75 /DNA_ID=CAMNT_0022045417 /DNA_START=1259 /DNA_END=1483 /DNA_ORIENTATION=+
MSAALLCSSAAKKTRGVQSAASEPALRVPSEPALRVPSEPGRQMRSSERSASIATGGYLTVQSSFRCASTRGAVA